MPDRTILPGLLVAALVLHSPHFALADAPAFPPGAETAGDAPPSDIMRRAAPLMQAGMGDEATFWVYAAQRRWRSRRNANLDHDRTGESALFSSLFETLGPSVNGWAFGDRPKLQRTIDAVLLWDERYPDPSPGPAVHQRMRTGLTSPRDQIGREADTIRSKRLTGAGESMRPHSRCCFDTKHLSHLLLASTMPLVISGSASAQDSPVADPLRLGLEGALRGCEIWVLDPSSWLDDPARFVAAIDVADAVFETESLPEPLLPPKLLRRGNRYWRINAGPTEGYALVVSRDIPMCHITGGGEVDFQPAAEAAVASSDFNERWERIGEKRRAGIVSTSFRLRVEPKLSLVLSRANAPGARRDRAQVIATATYDLDH